MKAQKKEDRGGTRPIVNENPSLDDYRPNIQSWSKDFSLDVFEELYLKAVKSIFCSPFDHHFDL